MCEMFLSKAVWLKATYLKYNSYNCIVYDLNLIYTLNHTFHEENACMNMLNQCYL